MKADKKDKKNFLKFRGKPLVRSGNTIYYGDINDRFIAEMQIKSSYDLNGMKISEKILVLLVDSELSDGENKKIIKMSEKSGLYNALNTGGMWLDSAKEFQMQS